MSETPDTPQVLVIESPSDLDWLDAAAQIYEDYLNNGLYWTKTNVETTRADSGAINWPRTISTHPPVFVNGAPLYLDVVRKLRARSIDDMLHRLHTSVIEEIAFTFTGRSARLGSYGLTDSEFEAIKTQPEPHLRNLFRKTFNDRGKRLLGLIGRYLRASTSATAAAREGGFFCQTEAYEFVWEAMLRQAFENPSGRASRALKSGKWTNGDLTTPGISPRIDFAHWSAAGLAIFDAKDKEVQIGRRSGSEQDHYKQICYAKLLAPTSVACNVLLFPRLRGSPSLFHYLGAHEWLDEPDSVVHEVSVDYFAISNAYVAGRTLDPTPLIEKLKRLPAIV